MRKRVELGISLCNRGPLIFPEYITVGNLLSMAEVADQNGFASLWVGDSLLAIPRLESISMLSAIAARTKLSKLGIACMSSFPMRDPVLLAYMLATLDHISSGRITLVACIGGGRGTTTGKAEYSALGFDYEKRAALLEEGIVIIRKLWMEDNVSYRGKFHHFESVSIIKPVQKPCLPIWIACNPYFGDERRRMGDALRRVARLGDGWMTTMCTARQFEESWKNIGTYAKETGRDPGELHASLYYNININPSKRKALAETKFFLDRYYNMDHTKNFVEVSTAAGTADQCIRRLEEYIEAGVRTIALLPTSVHQMEQLKRCISEVLPVF